MGDARTGRRPNGRSQIDDGPRLRRYAPGRLDAERLFIDRSDGAARWWTCRPRSCRSTVADRVLSFGYQSGRRRTVRTASAGARLQKGTALCWWPPAIGKRTSCVAHGHGGDARDHVCAYTSFDLETSWRESTGACVETAAVSSRCAQARGLNVRTWCGWSVKTTRSHAEDGHATRRLR
jgi:hypothetical protein